MKNQKMMNREITSLHAFQQNVSYGIVNDVHSDIQRVQTALSLPHHTRRHFLKTAGLLTGSFFTFDTLLFSKDAEAIDLYWWGKMLWGATEILAKAVLPIAIEYGIDYILRKMEESQIIPSHFPKTFHENFSNPVQFDLVESALDTIYGYFFGINGHPQTAPQSPIVPVYELNIFEIYAIIAQNNPANYDPDGHFFVPYPYEERRRPDSTDEEVFYHTSVIYDRFQVNPSSFQVEYVRCFSNGMDLLTGYGVKTVHSPHKRYFLLVGGKGR